MFAAKDKNKCGVTIFWFGHWVQDGMGQTDTCKTNGDCRNKS